MTFNDYNKKGNWIEVKGEIQKLWGCITDDELEKTQGDLKSIYGLILMRYGDVQKGFDEKLDNIYKIFNFQKDQLIDETKNILKH